MPLSLIILFQFFRSVDALIKPFSLGINSNFWEGKPFCWISENLWIYIVSNHIKFFQMLRHLFLVINPCQLCGMSNSRNQMTGWSQCSERQRLSTSEKRGKCTVISTDNVMTFNSPPTLCCLSYQMLVSPLDHAPNSPTWSHKSHLDMHLVF